MIMGWVRPPRPPRPRCLSDVKVANVAVRHGQCLRRGPCLPVSRLASPDFIWQLGLAKKTRILTAPRIMHICSRGPPVETTLARY
jgi:hypothetical protein